MTKVRDLYIKTLRIQYHDKIFDIFSTENHRKVFLEVHVKTDREEYYYPVFKDYLYLDRIYNKPFDGILYAKKYSFKQRIYLTTFCSITAFLLIDPMRTMNCKLQYHSLVYDSVRINSKTAEIGSTEHEVMESIIDIYDTSVLSEYGFEPVSFEDVRSTLANNLELSSKYKNYINKFINCLEEKLHDVDLRVFNNNLKSLAIYEDLNEKDSMTGIYIPKLNEIYLAKDLNLLEEKKAIFHELCHTLNYGYLSVETEGYENNILLVKKFRDDNYGIGFSEGLNTVLTSYLLSDDFEYFFDSEQRNFIDYSDTSPFCYQILRLLKEDYTLSDFISRDIHYLQSKLNNIELETVTDVLDTIHMSSYENKEICIKSKEQFHELEQTVYLKQIEKTEGFFEKLLIAANSTLKIEEETVYRILEQQPENCLVLPLREKTREQNKEDSATMVELYKGENEEIYKEEFSSIVIYRRESEQGFQYYFGRYITHGIDDSIIEDFTTNQAYQIEEINIIELSKFLPKANYEIQEKILRNPEFIKVLEGELEKEAELKKQYKAEIEQSLEEQKKRKEHLSTIVIPIIQDAIENGKQDLEICRLIVNEVTDIMDIKIAMEIFTETKADCLISYFGDQLTPMGTEIVIRYKEGDRHISSYDAVIYAKEDEQGIHYEIGVGYSEEEVYDLYREKVDISECINQKVIKLSEIIPEIHTYNLDIEVDFFNSKEFINLIGKKITNTNELESTEKYR